MDDEPQDSVDLGERLVEHRSALRAFLARRIKDRSELDDYVQDVYVRALVSERSAAVRNWRGYLLRIASSLIVDQNRKDTVRQRDRHQPLDEAPEQVDTARSSPEDETVARDQLSLIRRELNTLSPVARDCFVLVRLEGLRPAEAARRLDLTEKAVTRHLERTTARLAQTLLEHP